MGYNDRLMDEQLKKTWQQAEEKGGFAEYSLKADCAAAYLADRAGTRIGGIYAGWEAGSQLANSVDGPVAKGALLIGGPVTGGVIGNTNAVRSLGAVVASAPFIPVNIGAQIADATYSKGKEVTYAVADSLLEDDSDELTEADLEGEVQEDDEPLSDGGRIIVSDDLPHLEAEGLEYRY